MQFLGAVFRDKVVSGNPVFGTRVPERKVVMKNLEVSVVIDCTPAEGRLQEYLVSQAEALVQRFKSASISDFVELTNSGTIEEDNFNISGTRRRPKKA